MAYSISKTGKSFSRECVRCGKPIRLLGIENTIPVLGGRNSEQRGFECIACGQISCFDCSDNRYRCSCGGNAWIARVYEGSLMPSITKNNGFKTLDQPQPQVMVCNSNAESH